MDATTYRPGTSDDIEFGYTGAEADAVVRATTIYASLHECLQMTGDGYGLTHPDAKLVAKYNREADRMGLPRRARTWGEVMAG